MRKPVWAAPLQHREAALWPVDLFVGKSSHEAGKGSAFCTRERGHRHLKIAQPPVEIGLGCMSAAQGASHISTVEQHCSSKAAYAAPDAS